MAQLYYIALLPDSQSSLLFEQYKDIAEHKFGTVVAKRSPAHITLVPPFRASKLECQQVIDALSRITFDNFKLALVVPVSGWGVFRKQTIYVAIENNPELNQCLLLVSEAVSKLLNISRGNSFVPHITIINRDLKEGQFSSAYEFFKTQPLPENLICSNLVLFEHCGRNWQKLACISFGSNV